MTKHQRGKREKAQHENTHDRPEPQPIPSYRGRPARNRKALALERYRLLPSGPYLSHGTVIPMKRDWMLYASPQEKLAMLTEQDRDRWNEYRDAFWAAGNHTLKHATTQALLHFIEGVGDVAFTQPWVLQAIWQTRNVAHGQTRASKEERKAARDLLNAIGPALTRKDSGPYSVTGDFLSLEGQVFTLDRAATEHDKIRNGLRRYSHDLHLDLDEARTYTHPSQREKFESVKEGITKTLRRAGFRADEIDAAFQALRDKVEPRVLARRVAAARHGVAERVLKTYLAARTRNRSKVRRA